MDPFTALLIVGAMAGSMYKNEEARKAQRDAQAKQEQQEAFQQMVATENNRQKQMTAASNARRRVIRGTGTGAIPTSTQAGQGLTTSNGGVNPNAGVAGTF